MPCEARDAKVEPWRFATRPRFSGIDWGARTSCGRWFPMRSPFPVHALRCSTTKGDFVRSPSCNHKGGPLSQGACSGEYVKCPWHGWEYSIVTGRGPTGFDEEQVAH